MGGGRQDLSELEDEDLKGIELPVLSRRRLLRLLHAARQAVLSLLQEREYHSILLSPPFPLPHEKRVGRLSSAMQ